ncbi:unnamed protein product [Camellia sinensis]
MAGSKRLKPLQLAQSAEVKSDSDNPIDISKKLQQLSSEAEQDKKMGEAAKSEVLKAMAAIEHTKTRIKTSDIRLVTAKKMKEVARATEVVALAEVKALSSSDLSTKPTRWVLSLTMTLPENELEAILFVPLVLDPPILLPPPPYFQWLKVCDEDDDVDEVGLRDVKNHKKWNFSNFGENFFRKR